MDFTTNIQNKLYIYLIKLSFNHSCIFNLKFYFFVIFIFVDIFQNTNSSIIIINILLILLLLLLSIILKINPFIYRYIFILYFIFNSLFCFNILACCCSISCNYQRMRYLGNVDMPARNFMDLYMNFILNHQHYQ